MGRVDGFFCCSVTQYNAREGVCMVLNCRLAGFTALVLGTSNDVIHFCLCCYMLSVWDFAVESTVFKNKGALSGMKVSSHHMQV